MMDLAYFTVVFNKKKKKQFSEAYRRERLPSDRCSYLVQSYHTLTIHVRTHTCISTYKYAYTSILTVVHYCHKQEQPITPIRPRLSQLLELEPNENTWSPYVNNIKSKFVSPDAGWGRLVVWLHNKSSSTNQKMDIFIKVPSFLNSITKYGQNPPSWYL